jgi:hypothetical protein
VPQVGIAVRVIDGRSDVVLVGHVAI